MHAGVVEDSVEAASDRSPGRDLNEVPQEATPNVGVVEEAVADPVSPIRSTGNIGETPAVSEDTFVDNINQPLGLLGADDPILFDSFFALAFVVRAERSPRSVHQVGLNGDRGRD
ncbi:hypothetical protein ACLOJK_018687 [Asimina triloba]